MVRIRMVAGELHRANSTGRPVPGDAWFAPEMVSSEYLWWYRSHYLSDEYLRDWLGKRPPLFLVLPDGAWFCLDSRASNAGTHGWTVTGRLPKISASPSIVSPLPGGFHGFLRGGELS